MAYDSLDAFLIDLPTAAEAARGRLRGQNGRFCLETRQGRRLYVLLWDGEITLPKEDPGPFDCVVTADERDLLDILNGKLNPAAALLLRKVKVKGDFAKLLALAKLA